MRKSLFIFLLLTVVIISPLTQVEADETIENYNRIKSINPSVECIHHLILFLAGNSVSMMSGSCVPIDAGEGKAYLV